MAMVPEEPLLLKEWHIKVRQRCVNEHLKGKDWFWNSVLWSDDTELGMGSRLTPSTKVWSKSSKCVGLSSINFFITNIAFMFGQCSNCAASVPPH